MVFPLVKQPKISCLLRPFPHVAPAGAAIANSRPADAVTTKRVVGACGVAAPGAGWFALIVTCCPAPTVTVPPAFAVTRIWPSSTLYVAEVVPSAFCVTFVSKAVPRTEAIEDGVLISNLESGLSFATAAHDRP